MQNQTRGRKIVLNKKFYGSTTAISRTSVIVAIIIIIILAAAGGYYLVSQMNNTTNSNGTTSSSTTSSFSTSSLPLSTQSTTTSSSANSGGSSSKSTLVIGTNYAIDTLDSGGATGFSDANLDHNINPGLVKFQYGTANVVPDAAENWTITNHGLTYTFNLRQDVKFNNGDPVNASTWAYSLNRNMKMPGGGFWMRPYIHNITATGPYTLVLNLNFPYAAFLSVAATGQVYEPLDPKQINGTHVFQGLVDSAGPYMVTNWQRNVELDLKANPYYFGPAPATPNIQLKFFQSSSALVLAAQSGAVDVVFGQLSPEEVSIVSSAPNFNLTQAAAPIPYLIGMNELMTPFQNASARQALAYLINRTQIIQTVYQGQASPLYSVVPQGVLGATTAFQSVYGSQPNVSAAKALLAQLGYSTSNPMQLTLWYVAGDATQGSIATLLSQQFSASGMIDVTLKTTDQATLFADSTTNKTIVQTFLTDLIPPYSDPDVFLAFFLSSQFRISYEGVNYFNPTINALINQERVSNSSAMRVQIASQVQNITAHDAPYIPMVQLNEQIEANKAVKGIILGGTTLFYFFLLYEPASAS